MNCNQKFSFFTRRRHHCRKCGGIFCYEHVQKFLFQDDLSRKRGLEFSCLNCLEDRFGACRKCNLRIQFKDCSNHLENICPERLVVCPNGCSGVNSKSVPAKNLEVHLTSQCRLRLVDCPDGCHIQIPYGMIFKHCQNECKMRQQCELGCNELIAISQKKNHQQNICVHRLISCPDCLNKVKAEDLTEHLAKECSFIPPPCLITLQYQDYNKSNSRYLIAYFSADFLKHPAYRQIRVYTKDGHSRTQDSDVQFGTFRMYLLETDVSNITGIFLRNGFRLQQTTQRSPWSHDLSIVFWYYIFVYDSPPPSRININLTSLKYEGEK